MINKRHTKAKAAFMEMAKSESKEYIKGAAEILAIYTNTPDFGKEYYDEEAIKRKAQADAAAEKKRKEAKAKLDKENAIRTKLYDAEKAAAEKEGREIDAANYSVEARAKKIFENGVANIDKQIAKLDKSTKRTRGEEIAHLAKAKSKMSVDMFLQQAEDELFGKKPPEPTEPPPEKSDEEILAEAKERGNEILKGLNQYLALNEDLDEEKAKLIGDKKIALESALQGEDAAAISDACDEVNQAVEDAEKE